MLAQDAAGGNASIDAAPFGDGGIPFDDDEEFDTDDFGEEDFGHPPGLHFFKFYQITVQTSPVYTLCLRNYS